jgi:glutathione synthase
MRLAFILDPLASLATYKDSSLAIMRAAAKRGHALFVAEQGGLFLRQDQARLNVHDFRFIEGNSWYEIGEMHEDRAGELRRGLHAQGSAVRQRIPL